MCFKRRNKWQLFTPTKEYLDAIKDVTTIEKLDTFLDRIQAKSDVSDHWQTPEETLNRGTGDCEDYARLAIDILVRIIKIDEARFVVYNGYNRNNKKGAHVVCVFPYQGKLATFSGSQLLTGYDDYVTVGHEFYPNGLKYMEIRDWTGKVTKRKFKLIGTF